MLAETISLPSNYFGTASLPSYPRGPSAKSIVHLGVGNFHRSHLAAYVDELLERHGSQWSIIGSGIRERDAAIAHALENQYCLYTLVEASQHTERSRVIGSISDYLFAYQNPAPLISAMSSESTKIVSLTITEGGYPLSHGGQFDPTHSDIQADLAKRENPTSAFAFILRALERRFAAKTPPFTILSCDNIQSNGEATKKCLLGLAQILTPHLVSRISDQVHCPNSMVDRITPATGDALLHHMRSTYDSSDQAPVLCESFRQWVLEDLFPLGRPNFEDVGAHFTNSVHPYEEMKMRLLNGGHSLIAYLGILSGFEFIHQALENTTIQNAFRLFMRKEVLPSLRPVPGVNLSEYQNQLVERFLNHRIADTISRVAGGGSAKLPKFIYPTIEENLARGASIELLTLSVAGWLTYLRESDFQGRSFQAIDEQRERLNTLVSHAVTQPSILFHPNAHLFPRSMAENRYFQSVLLRHLQGLRLGDGHAYVRRIVESVHSGSE